MAGKRLAVAVTGLLLMVSASIAAAPRHARHGKPHGSKIVGRVTLAQARPPFAPGRFAYGPAAGFISFAGAPLVVYPAVHPASSAAWTAAASAPPVAGAAAQSPAFVANAADDDNGLPHGYTAVEPPGPIDPVPVTVEELQRQSSRAEVVQTPDAGSAAATPTENEPSTSQSAPGAAGESGLAGADVPPTATLKEGLFVVPSTAVATVKAGGPSVAMPTGMASMPPLPEGNLPLPAPLSLGAVQDDGMASAATDGKPPHRVRFDPECDCYH